MNTELSKFYEELNTLFKQKNPDNVLLFIEKCIHEAEMNDDKYTLIALNNELGGFCRAKGDLVRAKNAYNIVLSLLNELSLYDTANYATALLNTGDVYINSKEYTKALEFFLQAKKLFTKLGIVEDYRIAALNNNISMAYRELERYEEAEDALKSALEIIKKMPTRRGDLATTLVNLGELQIKQRKFSEAETTLLRAVNIYEEKGGIHTHYSSACAALGNLYFLQGKILEAERYYIKALQLVKRDFGITPYYQMLEKNLEYVQERKSTHE